jgi:hypothetical protein
VLLWAGLWIVLVQAAINLLLGSVWWRVRFPEMANVVLAWKQLSPPPDIVAIGSSRTGSALNDDLVRRILNEGRTGQPLQLLNAAISAGDFFVMERLLERADQEHLPLPRLLVVEVSPDLLAGPRFWAYSQNLLRQFTWQDTLAQAPDILRTGNTMRALGAQLNPVFAHRRQLCRHLYQVAEQSLVSSPKPATPVLSDDRFKFATPPSGQPAAAGPAFAPKPPTDGNDSPVALVSAGPSTSSEALRATAVRACREWVPGYQVSDTAVRSLRRILDRCRQHHVAVLLAMPPLHSFYREQIPPSVRVSFQQVIGSLCAETGCRLVDLEQSVSDEGVPDLLHCNRAGAEQYVRALVRQGLRPALDVPVVAGR